MLLKVRFVKLEKALVMQVLEQAKDQTYAFREMKFKSSLGISINSYNHPELYEEKVYLRGIAKERDFSISYMIFDNNKKRDEHLSKLLAALEEWRNNNGFLGKKTKPVKSTAVSDDDFVAVF